jgi:subtilisin-like proprotein convertase family protein
MNGTSSGTPNTLGVAALMLSANPTLTWRDVKDILASTSDKVDPHMQPTANPLDPPGFVSCPGWTTNAAGYNFNTWYGFGRPNAQNAVAVAQNYKSPFGTFRDLTNTGLNGAWKYLKPVSLPIADNNIVNPTSVDTITVSENIIIEGVQIQLDAVHPNVADLAIELTAPSGETSLLIEPNNALTQSNITGWILETNAFYGENGQGVWKLTVMDCMAGPPGDQAVTEWGINISGYTPE